jgi:hypothetical protein
MYHGGNSGPDAGGMNRNLCRAVRVFKAGEEWSAHGRFVFLHGLLPLRRVLDVQNYGPGEPREDTPYLPLCLAFGRDVQVGREHLDGAGLPGPRGGFPAAPSGPPRTSDRAALRVTWRPCCPSPASPHLVKTFPNTIRKGNLYELNGRRKGSLRGHSGGRGSRPGAQGSGRSSMPQRQGGAQGLMNGHVIRSSPASGPSRACSRRAESRE